MLEGCAKNEVQNAVPNRSIDFSIVKSIFLKGCVRPLFGHFLQFSHFLLFFLSLESISHSVFSKNGVLFSRVYRLDLRFCGTVTHVTHVTDVRKVGT